MNKFIFCFFICLLTSSCSNEFDGTNTETDKKFFDLKGYMQSEIERLSDFSIQKEIKIDGESEQIKISDVAWEKELAIFFESDINKVAWETEFEVSQKNDVTTYTTENENIPVKKIQFLTDYDGNLNKLFITREKENLLYKSTEKISYRPTYGFQIITDRKIILSDPQKIEINASFVR